MRHHFAAEHRVHPAKHEAADGVRLRHIVHGKTREHLDEHEHVEAEIRHARQRISQVRFVRFPQKHVVKRDVHGLRVEMAFPETWEKAIAFVYDEAIDTENERRAETKCREEMNLADDVDEEHGLCRLERVYLRRLRDEYARDEHDDDRVNHDPVENSEEWAE